MNKNGDREVVKMVVGVVYKYWGGILPIFFMVDNSKDRVFFNVFFSFYT